MSARNSIACALLGCMLLQDPSAALAVCRVVVSVVERGGVQFDPTTMVLYVLAPQQIVGHQCPPAAGAGAPLPADGGPMTMTPQTGSDPNDGGADDGGEDDAGEMDAPVQEPMAMAMPPADSSCPGGAAPVPVHGSVVHMVVQPSVLSTGGRAGLVMPVPARPDIHASNPDLFDALGERLQPRIVNKTVYVEDESLGSQCNDPKFSASSSSSRSSGSSGGGCMGGGDDDSDVQTFDPGEVGDNRGTFYNPGVEGSELQKVMIADGVVKLERKLQTEDYDVTVLNASTADALDAWLDQNGFAHDDEDDTAFASYVAEGAWFVALDVHPSGERRLSPLVVSFRSGEIPLMHGLQYDSDGGEIVTEAFVMAQTPMAAADGSAVVQYAAPAGFGGEVAGFGLAQGWLTHLRFTRRMDEWMEDSTLVRVAPLEVRPVRERIETVLIPVSTCPAGGVSSSEDGAGCSGGDDKRRDDGGCLCSAEAARRDRLGGTLGPILLACLWIALQSRRRPRR